MTTFTNILPAAAAFGTEPEYIAINRKDWKMRAGQSRYQLEARFGLVWQNANGQDWVWAESTPEMAQALLAGQPAQGATGDSEVVRLRELVKEAAMLLVGIGSSMTADGAYITKKLEGEG